jgi:transposase
MNYIGLDVHKKTISYCVKDVSGRIQQEGKIGSTRRELDCWMKTLPQPWTVAMEATIFSGWIYDHLLPHATQIKVAHPLMLRAIAAAKKKNDQIDASKLADCLRCDFLPECHMMPRAIRDRRRTLRYRHLLVRQMVQMKNRVSGLLMETGVEYNKQRLHKVSYFRELLSEVFRDWQKTQTQSSVTALQGPRLQMDVWFCRAQEPMPRGTLLRVEHPETVDLHALPSVPGTPVPSLDR